MECTDLRPTDNGKEGERFIQVSCKGGTVSGTTHISTTTFDWSKLNEEVIQDFIDRGMTREEAVCRVIGTSGFVGVEYEVTIGKCGKVLRESVDLVVENRRMWTLDDSPRIRPKIGFGFDLLPTTRM